MDVEKRVAAFNEAYRPGTPIRCHYGAASWDTVICAPGAILRRGRPFVKTPDGGWSLDHIEVLDHRD